MIWSLPCSLSINGVECPIDADYRIILEIISRLTKGGAEEYLEGYICLAIFYQNFDEIQDADYQEALDQLLWFISCGEASDCPRGQKLIDWEQDYQLIVSDINKVAGHDVRADEFCHWWTFCSWFMGIGEGQLSTVVSIREKLRKGKRLESWEREYYKKNRSRVDFKRGYTKEEDDFIKRWSGR